MSKNLHFSSLYSRKRCEMRERFAENSTRVKDRAIKTRTICIFCAFNYHLFLAKFMIWCFLLLLTEIHLQYKEASLKYKKLIRPRRQVTLCASLLLSFILNFRISFFFLNWILSCLLFLCFCAYLLRKQSTKGEDEIHISHLY
jgi:hypothetical protein